MCHAAMLVMPPIIVSTYIIFIGAYDEHERGDTAAMMLALIELMCHLVVTSRTVPLKPNMRTMSGNVAHCGMPCKRVLFDMIGY